MSMPSPPRKRPPTLLALLLIGIAIVVIVLFLRHDQGTTFGLSNDDFARLALLVAILIFVGAGFLGRRLMPGEIVQSVASWLLIFAVLVGIYAFRDELTIVGGRLLGALVPGVPLGGRLAGESDGNAVAVMRSADGHFAVRANVDGFGLTMLVDTGASFVTLSHDDATRVGINTASLQYRVPVNTANGAMTAAPITIDSLSIGDIRKTGIRGLVAPEGALEQSLLGMTFLDTLRGYAISGDRLILTP